MTLEQFIYTVIGGGGVVSAIVALWTSRHKPRIDTSAEQRGWFDELQEERNTAKEEVREVKAALKACEDTARQDRMRWDTERREMQGRIDDLLRQNGALGSQLDAAVGHVWLLETGIRDSTIPPIPMAPYVLHHLLHAARADQPTVRDDNGVPGTEASTNPPPSDDGQDLPPQE